MQVSINKEQIVGFDHIAFNVSDIEKSVSWYVENLSCDVLYQDSTWAMLGIAGTKIALTLPNQHPPHIAFTISSEASLTGSEVEFRKHRDGSSYVYASDPDGNTIEWLVYTDKPE